MGRGDFVLYKNTERNFEVSILSFLIKFETTTNSLLKLRRITLIASRWLLFGKIVILFVCNTHLRINPREKSIQVLVFRE